MTLRLHYKSIIDCRTIMHGLRRVTALCLVCASVSHAAEYPERPIRITVPQPPGGGADLILRSLAPELQRLLKQPVIVENRPGGNETIAAQAVAQAAPDGYTLGLISSTFSINQLGLGVKPPYDSERDFSAVASLVRVPMALLVHADLDVKDVNSLVQLSKEKRGQLNYMSLGPTTFQGIATEWLKRLSGADLTPIAYGAQVNMQTLTTGEVHVTLLGFGAAAAALQTKKVKAIAITSKARMKEHPNIPSVAETYPDYDITPWYAIVAPAKTPTHVVAKLNEAFNLALASPGMRERYSQLGSEPMPMSTGEFQRFLAQDIAMWRSITTQMPAQQK